MIITVNDSPRSLVVQEPGRTVHLRATTVGNIYIAPEQQTVQQYQGLPIHDTDGIVSLVWEHPRMWITAASGTLMEVEVILP